jgi:hypothetical protein
MGETGNYKNVKHIEIQIYRIPGTSLVLAEVSNVGIVAPSEEECDMEAVKAFWEKVKHLTSESDCMEDALGALGGSLDELDLLDEMFNQE